METSLSPCLRGSGRAQLVELGEAPPRRPHGQAELRQPPWDCLEAPAREEKGRLCLEPGIPTEEAHDRGNRKERNRGPAPPGSPLKPRHQ